MGVFQMVIVIVFLGVIAGMFNKYLEYKKSLNKKRNELDEQIISKELTTQKMINKELEKRIQALESIVTSDEYDLNQKFKGLKPNG
jgi:predicted Holliday junction resolvase-like endonuclease